MKNKWIKLGGTVATVLALTASVQAIPSAPSFQISLNGTTWTSEINGFFGSFGSFTTVQLGATITGTGANPILDLSTLNVAGTGTLYVEMSATGFGPTTAPYFAHLGGNIGGSDSVTWNSYVSSLNTLYATSTQLFNATGLVGAVNSSQSGTINQSGIYSMTEEYIITSTGNSVSLDGNISTQVPDGGATAMLLGSALSALALFRKKLIA